MLLLLLLLIHGFMPFAAVAQIATTARKCDISGNYTAKSTYQTNLELLAAKLPKNASSTRGFYAKGSIGAARPDTVYGLALCRGDITDASICGACVADAFQNAQELCAFNKGAAFFNDSCIIRFSDKNFIDDASSNDDLLIVYAQRTTIITYDMVKYLVQQTAKTAAYDSARYATGIMDVIPRLYSMTQCRPDMPSPDCEACLKGISDMTTEYFAGRPGGRVLGARCNFRYEIHPFYEGQPTLQVPAITNTTAPPPAAVPSQKHQKRMSKALVITATVVSLLVSLFLFIFCFGWIKRRQQGKARLQDKVNIDMHQDAFISGLEGRSSEFTFFDFSQVTDATSNFSDENKLGEGGFGPVYKGQLPDDGLEIAIKRLASHSGQGFAEFKNEVQLIAKLQHTNLVRLLGCCTQREEKMLIYEYLPNRSLDFFIFDETRRALLNWNKRLAIIEGIAQGILYLHKHSRLRVIHRDLKASNILLDCEMNPKISDFGLAKIFSSNDTEGNTKRVVGTYGYMAPEYASEGIFSIKSDVFSYGVLILEVISGKKNSGFHQYGCFFNLLGYVWKLWKEERSLELVDTSIVSEIHALEMIRCVNIALLCVQENAADRPTMSDVVAMLSSSNMTLPEPKHPAYFYIRVTKEESSKDVEPSINDVTISVLHGR